jgi:hypothetical protein
MRGGWTIRPPWVAFAGANVLHRDAFERLAPKFGVPAQDDEGLNTLARFWHALPAWPDVVGGLSRLKPRYMIAPLSNGHVALLVSMYCPHPVSDGHSHIRELTDRCCCRRAERATAACSPVRGHHRLVDCGPDCPRLSNTTNPDAIRPGIPRQSRATFRFNVRSRR